MLRVLTAFALAFGMIASASPAPAAQSAKVSHATRARIVAFSHVTESQIRRLIAVIGLPREAICDPNSSTPTQVNCVAVNSSGALSVATASGSTSAPQYTRIQSGTTTNLADVSSLGLPLSTGNNGVVTIGVVTPYNGSGFESLRTAAGITGGSAPTGELGVGICNGQSSTGNCASVFPLGVTGIGAIGLVGVATQAYPVAYNGTSTDMITTTQKFNGYQTGLLATGVVSNEPMTATYTANSGSIANSAAGVFFELSGAAGHVIRVRSCVVTGVATAVTATTLAARVLSSADSGGTAGTAPTVGALDGASPATAATAVTYTTPPTQGTVQAAAYSQQITLEPLTPTAGVVQELVTLLFPNTENAQPPTLRSASQQFVLFSTSSSAGTTWTVTCKFTDTSS